MSKLVYEFKRGLAEGDASQKDLLGGKGANLCEMANLNFPVTPGVILPTTWSVQFMGAAVKDRHDMIVNATDIVISKFDMMAEVMGYEPLVSVRSGARVSMPGMMDTILNVGLTVENMEYYKGILGERATLDCYRRLIQMLGETVYHMPHADFEKVLAYVKSCKYGLKDSPASDGDFTVKHLNVLVDKYNELFTLKTGLKFSELTIHDQIGLAIEAVWNSWDSERAKEYRKLNSIPDDWGTAVTVQAMVYGNADTQSCSGVLFTRNPATGDSVHFGEYLVNAQGEDVVAGTRTPEPISNLEKWNKKVFEDLLAMEQALETRYRDMQDVEFTVQSGALWLLQTRTGKRSAMAAFRIAHDLAVEGRIEQVEALKRVTGKQYLTLTKPQVDPTFKTEPTVVGIAAAGSIATGRVVLSKEAAKDAKEPVILVRTETTPDDFAGMVASVGILTTTGGATSHAAVVARGMDKACVVGCSDLVIGSMIKEGDKVTIDGKTGRVWINVDVPVISGKIDECVMTLIGWGKKALPDDVFLRVKKSGMKATGNLWVDCSDLVGKEDFQEVMEKMWAGKNAKCVLDLVADHRFEDDHKFLAYLGLDAGSDKDKAKMYKQMVYVLCFKKWPQEMLRRVVINCNGMPDEYVSQILERGWPIVRRVSCLKHLMEVNGMVEIDTAFASKLEESEGVAVAKVLELLKAAGKKVRAVPKVVSEEHLVFEILGK